MLEENGTCRTQDGELFISSNGDAEAVAVKMQPRLEYDFAINVRLDKRGDGAAWGFVLVDQHKKMQSSVTIDENANVCRFRTGGRSKKLKLPAGFISTDTHQIGVLINNGNMIIRLEDIILGKSAAPQTETAFGVYCKDATVAVEMARLTAL
jgi:hypothetical protein